MRFFELLGLLSLFFSSACSAGQIDASAPTTAGAAAPAAAVADYRLGAADKVRINVFNEPTLSGEFAVSTSGKLSMPLIGDVDAAGRTPSEVRDQIQMKLADGFLKEPRVAIEVLTYRPFFILGEVNKPGEYPYSSGLTVMNAVATAQGFTYRAQKGQVFLKRGDAKEEISVKLTPDLLVQPGDTIRVGERYF
jgi:polysaccharide export outer membrane protein